MVSLAGLKKLLRLKMVVPAVALALIILATMLVLHSASAPVNGNIRVNQPEGPAEVAAILVATHGSYVSFEQSSDYIAMPGEKPSDAILENFSFSNHKLIPSANLYISVLPLPSGSLADEGAYQFRLKSPAKYQPETWMINGSPVTLMDDTGGGYYKVAFVTHQSLVAEVAISSAGSSNEVTLDNDLKTVLTNLKWLKNG